MKSKKLLHLYQSPFCLFIIISASVLLVELLIMFILPLLALGPCPFSSNIGIFIDSFTLSILLFPIIYFFMLSPLRLHMGEREKAKKDWEATFDSMKDPLFIHDSKFRIVRANRAYEAVSSMSFKDIIGSV